MNGLSYLALDWSKRVFGPYFEQITPKTRALRLLEEVLELVQA
jgi:hypothetical protein